MARGGAIGRAGDDRESPAFRKPMIDRALRFVPPERVREDGRVRSPRGESLQEEMLRERQSRRAAEESGRRAEQQRQQEAAAERATRWAPTASDRSPSTPASGGDGSERTGKPLKE